MNVNVSASASPAGWRHTINTNIGLKPSHLIKFSVVGGSWGCCVRSNGTTHFLVGIGDDGKPTVQQFDGASYSQLASRPETYSGPMDVVIQFNEVRFGTSDDLWHIIAMWINGIHVINHSVSRTTSLSSPVYFGFAVRAGAARTFSNVYIPQLGEMAESATLDVNETPASGLQRTIDGRHLKYQMRYNGQLRAFRPQANGATYQLDEFDSFSEEEQTHQIRTHVRMVGAYEFAEFTRDDLIPKYDYSFKEYHNPFLMSEQDCYTEAENTIRRIREDAISGSVSHDALHFLEVEDRIDIMDNPRIVNAMTLSYRGPSVNHRIDYRGDVWDE